MHRNEFQRIAVREELKRISEVMAEMLTNYISLYQKKKLSRFEKGQVASIHQFFESLSENVVTATEVLSNPVMEKALKCYRKMKRGNDSEEHIKRCYNEFLKAYNKVARIWVLESLN